MSIEFDVVFHKRMMVSDLCFETQSVLQELLNLRVPPHVEVKHWTEERPWIGKADDTCAFTIGDLGRADITVFELPYDEFDPYRKQLTVVIDADWFRTEISIVLAAALAIAVGRKTEADVHDHATLLSPSLSTDPTMLLETVKLTEQHDDLLLAAHQFLIRIGMRD